MRSLRSPLPIRPLRSAASLAARSLRSFSCRRACSTCKARALLPCWLRPSWHSATMPVGRCTTRTAESVLLICWPPAPLARKVSMRSSAGLSAMGRAGPGSGIRATGPALGWGYQGGGGGDGGEAALGLGARHALPAVAAGLEFERAVDLLAVDAQHDFLIAAKLGRVLAEHLDLPASAGGV